MIIIILFLILVLIIPLFFCRKSFKTKSGNSFISNNTETAEVIEVLSIIAHDVPNHIKPNIGNKLRNSLKNTSFVEIIDGDPKIVGWNYNKGREIGVRILNRHGKPYSCEVIIDTLLHELAHSINIKYGHGEGWQELNNYLQKLKPKYVEVLINKTFLVR
tara:strand:- start:5 stop:484 length:480 start_codon:yes stop_codon:yes gene_type:complete